MTGFDYAAVPALIRRFLPGSRTILGAAVVCALVSAAAELLLPYAVYRTLSQLITGQSNDSIAALVLLGFAGIVITYVSLGISISLAHIAAFDVIRRIRSAIGVSWARSDVDRLGRTHSANARSASSEQAEKLEAVIAHGVPETVSGIGVWLWMTVWMMGRDWRMGIACLVIVPIAFATIQRAMTHNSHRMAEWMAASGEMTRAIGDQLGAVQELRVFGARRSGRHVVDSIRKSARLQVAWGAAFLRFGAWFSPLAAATPAFAAVTGAWLLAAGGITADTFLLFMVLSPAYTIPLVNAFYRMHTLPMAAAGARAILGQLDTGDTSAELSSEPDTNAHSAGGMLEFEDVRYDYPEQPATGEERALALDGITLGIPKGTFVVVVGVSGSGKSTLLELACGLRRPGAGRITLGGVLADTDLVVSQGQRASGPRGKTCRAFSISPQDPMLFSGTVAENLRLADPEAEESQLLSALEAVGLAGELDPNPLKRSVGDGGSSVSGGQAQRLSVARALVAGAEVTLLDEPTAALDGSAQRRLVEGVRHWSSGRTVVVATHRLELARDADMVVVLDRGRLAEVGTYDEISGSPLAAQLIAAEALNSEVRR